jgi:transmembrane sensor
VAGASESFARAAPDVGPPASPSSSAPRSAPWQKLARAGQYDRAYAMIENEGASVPDEPEQLLLAADSARLSGHNPRAAAFLRRLVDKFPADSRAGLAALTLGRVLLDDLGQPRDAARAFATAESRGGPLTEDALAREVDAWTRAGDHAAAKTAAARYLASYPMGRHAAFVRRLAGEP